MEIEKITVDPIAQEAMTLAETSYWGNIEDAFMDYAKHKDTKRFCNHLQSSLSFLLHKEFEVIISNVNRKEPFFGMHVFPSIEWIDKMVKSIVIEGIHYKKIYNQWSLINSWVIEIDAQLFDQYALSLNPKELTAILLHEIGHVAASDEVPERFYRLYQEYSISRKLQRDPSIKALYMLYTIPLAVSCMTKICVKPNIESRNIEIKADRFVIVAGYGDQLLSAMNKIIHTYGNTVISENDEDMAEKKVEESINWATLNARDFIFRKNHLKDELFIRTKKMHSGYIAMLSSEICDKVGVRLKERYRGEIITVTMEALLSDREYLFPKYEIVYEPKTVNAIKMDIRKYENRKNSDAMEGFTLKKQKTLDIPTQFDIDSIAIEIDRMENQHDRMYVLDLIYYQLDRLDKIDEYIGDDLGLNAKYRSKINQYRASLEQMRQTVLNKHNFNKEYKLWVKYPSGYEG